MSGSQEMMANTLDPLTRITDSCESSFGYYEENVVPLQERQVLSTAKLSLQPPTAVFNR